jgi:hypothetical protein
MYHNEILAEIEGIMIDMPAQLKTKRNKTSIKPLYSFA